MTETMQQQALEVAEVSPEPLEARTGPRAYPLEIQAFGDGDGEVYGVYSKGHHGAGSDLSGPDSFLAAARKYLLEEEDWDAKELDELLEAVGPSFLTWRCVPARGYGIEPLTMFVPAKPGSRGSFPVTVLLVDG
jgi:hypothetical protein